MDHFSYDIWPALPYEEFKPTAHLLHMAVQMIGKLKLYTPFEPHWANVPLWLSSRGLTSGPIPYHTGTFNIDIDFIDHRIHISTSWELTRQFALESMSVAQFKHHLFTHLRDLQIDLDINPMPQEVAHPLSFDQDVQTQPYNKKLAVAWWRILLSTYRVMQAHHARFDGESPPIGLMWGTFDLRDARYNGTKVPTTGINAGYIRRNAMDEAHIEIGWWHGNESYPRAAFYSYTYPAPANVEQAIITPPGARFDNTLGEFILDYDLLRKMKEPEKNLLSFFESTYQAGATYSQWSPSFTTTGIPV